MPESAHLCHTNQALTDLAPAGIRLGCTNGGRSHHWRAIAPAQPPSRSRTSPLGLLREGPDHFAAVWPSPTASQRFALGYPVQPGTADRSGSPSSATPAGPHPAARTGTTQSAASSVRPRSPARPAPAPPSTPTSTTSGTGRPPSTGTWPSTRRLRRDPSPSETPPLPAARRAECPKPDARPASRRGPGSRTSKQRPAAQTRTQSRDRLIIRAAGHESGRSLRRRKRYSAEHPDMHRETRVPRTAARDTDRRVGARLSKARHTAG